MNDGLDFIFSFSIFFFILFLFLFFFYLGLGFNIISWSQLLQTYHIKIYHESHISHDAITVI